MNTSTINKHINHRNPNRARDRATRSKRPSERERVKHDPWALRLPPKNPNENGDADGRATGEGRALYVRENELRQIAFHNLYNLCVRGFSEFL